MSQTGRVWVIHINFSLAGEAVLQRCARLARGWRVRHVARRRSRESRKTLQQSYRRLSACLSGVFAVSFRCLSGVFAVFFRRLSSCLSDVFPTVCTAWVVPVSGSGSAGPVVLLAELTKAFRRLSGVFPGLLLLPHESEG